MSDPRKWWALMQSSLLLLGTAALVGLEWLRPEALPPDELPTLLPRTVAVAPGVYLLGGLTPAPAYAVETSAGLALIDSGLKPGAVAEPLAEAGLDLARLRAVLLTHVHGDHSLGAEWLRERTGATVYAGRGDCRPLRDGGPREAFFGTCSRPRTGIHPTTVDVALSGGETIELGDTRFTAIAAPGHTPGSVCYLLERPGLRALFTGDVVQCLSPTKKGSLGTCAAYLPPRYRGNAADYLASLRRLQQMAAPDLVLPGQPYLDAVPQSPRLTPERWHALLADGIRELELLRARFDTDGTDFLDGTPRELLPGLHYLGDFRDEAVYCLDSPRGLFLFDAPGGPELTSWLAQRFEALGWAGRNVSVVFLTSAETQATAGLTAVAQAAGCKVVVPKAGLDAVRRLCPAGTDVITEDELRNDRLLEGEAVALPGQGVAPLAYRFTWAGKTVLVTGRIPGKPSDSSLAALNELSPDLWLPSTPVHGQNANLYDEDWSEVLRRNGLLVAR